MAATDITTIMLKILREMKEQMCADPRYECE